MTDTSNAGTINDLFRSLGSALNRGAYFLLSIMYQIFFNVASAQLFENETIKNFYGRIQLIIGVFMVFKLSISILQGIMNPDQFMDPKSGFGSFITRVITALFLLTVLVPISIPDVEEANSYEKYINNNGILFGTLYSLQDRILSNNTLGRLILGTTDGDVEDTSNDESDGLSESERQNKKLEKSANVFTSTILKGFLRINMKPEDSWEDDDSNNRENWYCGADLNDDAESAVETYNQLNVSPSILLNDNLVNADCDIEKGFLGVRFLGGKGGYVFLFDWLWSLFVGVIVLIIFVGFTVDIAIRSIKLAILRLLAPIPAISYIDPKSAKDGMFASWVKALTSTYLDLFLRLAIVYFVIFLIQDMIVNGIIINTATGVVGVFSFIFIVIGLLLFAKMAPKFITDALGLKGAMSNIGLSGILGGGAMLAGGGGLSALAMGAMQGVDAAVKGQAQGKSVPLGSVWSQNSDAMAKIRTGDKDAHGGFFGSALDRLNYQTRERRARKLGIGSKDYARASYVKNMYEQEQSNALANLESAKMRLQAANIGDEPMLSDYQNSNGSWKSSELEQKYYKDKSLWDSYQKASDNYKSASKKYDDAKRDADRIDKERQAMGVNPRIVDVEHDYKTKFGKYRVPHKVKTVNGVAVDSHGNPTNEPSKYTYSQSSKNYNGAIDETTYINNRPSGPPPRP